MRSIISFFLGVFIVSITANATEIPVDSWLSAGPFEVFKPAWIEGANIKKEEYSEEFLLKQLYLDLKDMRPSEGMEFLWSGKKPGKWAKMHVSKGDRISIKPDRKAEFQLSYSSFYVESDGLNKYNLTVESPQMFEIFLDGKMIKSTGSLGSIEHPNKSMLSLDLDRGKFVVVVKSLFIKGDEDSWNLKASLTGTLDSDPVLSILPRERMDIHHLLEGTKLRSVSLSADGELAIITYSRIDTKTGKTTRWTEIKEMATGRLIQSFRKGSTTGYSWMPKGQKLYYRIKTENGSSLWVYDIEKGTEYEVLKNIKELGSLQWANDESFIIYSISEKGDKKEKSSLLYMDELYNRTFSEKEESFLYKYDIKSGISTRLTFGNTGTLLSDISPDGRYIVLNISKPIDQRPFGEHKLVLMDLQENNAKLLWESKSWGREGSVQFSPDGKKLLTYGGPDCFDGVGRNIAEGQIANNYDTQLFIYDLESGKVDPITKDFDPSVNSAYWHPLDNNIYISVGEEIYGRVYSWNEKERKFNKLNTVSEVAGGFDVAENAAVAVYTGNQQGMPDRAWLMDLQDGSNKLIDTREYDTYKNVDFAKSEEWDFTAKSGTKIRGYFIYPLNFDPAKNYPLIVNYYGGTSPVEKSFGGRYPQDIWAGEDYVVYVPQPSGATGFGQEFSARHQNNWGITVADEIIEGTEKFMQAHSFVDKERVGCIGASYGGFMTMLLATRTDIFACAISHAGISSISSYWGEGYWGYIYSSEATGGSYPWNRRDIYVDQSPLFSADKVNTPLLLLHGSKDTNVPLGESLQLWVGLKILGKPVEMVQIEGEDHHILTYSKRIEWHNSIMAWFDKWLNDKGADWKTLFPESKL